MSNSVKLIEKELLAKNQIIKQLKKMREIENNLKEVYMPSYSTSIIVVSTNSNKNNKSKIYKTIDQKIDDEIILKKYTNLLAKLKKIDKLLVDIINYKIFMNLTFHNIMWELHIDRNTLAYQFNKACLILAFLDRDIDFDINDYYIFCSRSHGQSYSLQEVVKLLMVQADKMTEGIMKDIAGIFDLLNIEMEYFYEKKDVFGAEKFLKIIYSIAYLHPSIFLDAEDFLLLAKRTRISKVKQEKILKIIDKKERGCNEIKH